jgi:hypothetical protein
MATMNDIVTPALQPGLYYAPGSPALGGPVVAPTTPTQQTSPGTTTTQGSTQPVSTLPNYAAPTATPSPSATGTDLFGITPNPAQTITGPVVPSITQTAPQALGQNIQDLPQIEQIAQGINQGNLGFVQQEFNQLPGYSFDLQQEGQNIGQEESGQLPQSVVNQLETAAAERGIATGSPGSPNSNAALMQALGLNSLQLEQTGEQNLNAATAALPQVTPFDASSQLISPSLAQTAAQESAQSEFQQQQLTAEQQQAAAALAAAQAGTQAGNIPAPGNSFNAPALPQYEGGSGIINPLTGEGNIDPLTGQPVNPATYGITETPNPGAVGTTQNFGMTQAPNYSPVTFQPTYQPTGTTPTPDQGQNPNAVYNEQGQQIDPETGEVIFDPNEEQIPQENPDEEGEPVYQYDDGGDDGEDNG